jgi:hypothetical protein
MLGVAERKQSRQQQAASGQRDRQPEQQAVARHGKSLSEKRLPGDEYPFSGYRCTPTTTANPSRETGFLPRAGSSGTGIPGPAAGGKVRGSTILAGPAGALGFSGALAAAMSKA